MDFAALRLRILARRWFSSRGRRGLDNVYLDATRSERHRLGRDIRQLVGADNVLLRSRGGHNAKDHVLGLPEEAAVGEFGGAARLPAVDIVRFGAMTSRNQIR